MESDDTMLLGEREIVADRYGYGECLVSETPWPQLEIGTSRAWIGEEMRQKQDAMSLVRDKSVLLNFGDNERTQTWSSALLALSMARSMSLSPSPFALYAPRISRRLGGGGYEN